MGIPTIFTQIQLSFIISILSLIVVLQGIYIWAPWRQDVSVVLPTIAPESIPATQVQTPYGTVQTDYTKIVNPAEIETRITLVEYNMIKIGMSYEDIVDIIGGDGLVFNRTEAGGQVFVTYMYYGTERGANANFIFQNDKLINKAQYGVK